MKFVLTAFLCMVSLTPSYSATLDGSASISAICDIGRTVTGRSVDLSLGCSGLDDVTGVYGELSILASANDVYGNGEFRLIVDIPFTEDRIFVHSYLSLQAQANGLLSIVAPSPTVDLKFPGSCEGVAEFPPTCVLSLNIDGSSHEFEGGEFGWINNIPTNRPMPYTLYAATGSFVDCCDWESKDHMGGFSYDLRDPTIRDHETGAILENAKLRIVPEPTTAALIGLGLIAAASVHRRRP
jgi:PEP-CTERM motif